MLDYFPKTIASGEAFCNRNNERKRMISNLKKLSHTLLIASRRYGKTSLALQAIKESKIDYAYIDFFLAFDEMTLKTRIFEGISQLITKITPQTIHALKKAEAFFKNLKVNITFGGIGFEFQIIPNHQPQNFREILIALDHLLQKYNKKIVIFIDELQEIYASNYCNEIEAALRFTAQKTQHISFIFSGSNRHLLSKIFDDSRRPLYKLCDRILLNRIDPADYMKYFNKAAKKTWQKTLEMPVVEKIFEFSQCHPYYVNDLCSRLWLAAHPPKVTDAIHAWEQLSLETASSLAQDLEQLNPKYRHLLKLIAKQEKLTSLFNKEFLQACQFSQRGLSLAIDKLMQYDFIEKTTDGVIRIIDPLLFYLLTK